MKKLIETFYTGLSNLDAETMISCYHDDVVFEDPGFGKLKGNRAKGMWRMLCKNARNFRVEFSQVEANDQNGSAHWEAWYSFSKTGRSVHNKIDAQFEFKDGKIIKHTDDFNLHRWASQAIGWKGALLGGTSFFKKKLIRQTNKMLDKFMAS
ncbi:ketosteroid isomerase-like protein [Aquimarina sp. EL_43]|uniref:nuclear transport factor 2 family protein n=1 Tax=Aquimarina TaxID=290174 RepID=UPI00046F5467|nr:MULTISPECIES: nuclear transport factor 2 family protein [Aquimarina]MBG6131606.1 ketosteroid isomerase-like protein [Aquimarina sp. EL_35]MBG6152067.1 ketosteroid isomerase-like protein [Aquimarina sp. EL_32]MBG6169989.1 ketosteroid isomerase-like protein [Aquimarina sp. EL_43]